METRFSAERLMVEAQARIDDRVENIDHQILMVTKIRDTSADRLP